MSVTRTFVGCYPVLEILHRATAPAGHEFFRIENLVPPVNLIQYRSTDDRLLLRAQNALDLQTDLSVLLPLRKPGTRAFVACNHSNCRNAHVLYPVKLLSKVNTRT